MMRFPAPSARRTASRRRAAFTLIELLTVMAIILLLAGLVLGLAGNAQSKAARSRAEGEIQAFSAAANNYQIDNGAYPRATDTDNLDPRVTTDDPASGTPSYSAASLVLFKLLSGNYYIVMSGTTVTFKQWLTGNTTVPKPTTYFHFKSATLKNSGNITNDYVDPTTVTAVLDPFGLSYGYSTAYQLDLDNSVNPPTHGYNPTYDLWSTGGYSAGGGKSYPSDLTSASYPTLWIKNW